MFLHGYTVHIKFNKRFHQILYFTTFKTNRPIFQDWVRLGFIKKVVFKNFAKFAGKYLSQSLFLIKLQAEACNFIKKKALVQVFSCEFCEIFKNIFLTEHLWVTVSAWFMKYPSRYLLAQSQ